MDRAGGVRSTLCAGGSKAANSRRARRNPDWSAPSASGQMIRLGSFQPVPGRRGEEFFQRDPLAADQEPALDIELPAECLRSRAGLSIRLSRRYLATPSTRSIE